MSQDKEENTPNTESNGSSENSSSDNNSREYIVPSRDTNTRIDKGEKQ